MLGEHLGRAGADGAVDPLPGLLRAPGHGAGLRVGQIDEFLTGEEVSAHVLDLPLDPGLVLGGADPGGVGGETTGLRVLQPAHRELRVDRIAWATIGFMLSGTRTLNTPPKNRHAASQPATTASNVVANVNHTNMCREYTAVKINACTTRRRPVSES